MDRERFDVVMLKKKAEKSRKKQKKVSRKVHN